MIDAGLPVVLWARRPETLEPYRDTPARFAGSIAELAAEARYIGICVVDDDGVRQVCEGIFPNMAPGGLVAIHSTVHPNTCRELARRGAELGLSVIDAPVSGGAPAAELGTLTVMVGGETGSVAAARPILETFGRLIVHLGDVGAGQQAKLVNNALLAANISVAHAALTAGGTLGVERSALVELLMASSGRSFGLEVAARMRSPGSFAHGASLLDKDLRLLGAVLPEDDVAFTILRDAALPFITQARSDS